VNDDMHLLTTNVRANWRGGVVLALVVGLTIVACVWICQTQETVRVLSHAGRRAEAVRP